MVGRSNVAIRPVARRCDDSWTGGAHLHRSKGALFHTSGCSSISNSLITAADPALWGRVGSPPRTRPYRGLNMEAHVEVVQRVDELVVVSYSWTDLGWTSNGWCEIHPLEVGREVLGRSIRSGADQSASEIPTPGRNDKPFLPVLQRTGCRTFRQFHQDAYSVGITLNGDTCTAIPDKNAWPKGFQPVPSLAVSHPAPTESDLGEMAYDMLVTSRRISQS